MPASATTQLAALERLHAPGKVGLGSLEDDMQMVAHDGEGIDAPATTKCRSTEVFQEPVAVEIIAYDHLPAVAAGHDVIDGIGVLETKSSGHAIHTIKFGGGSQIKTWN